MGTIRTRYENSNEKGIKTHLKCECGIVGFYDADELVKWYGDCDYEIREYEKLEGQELNAVKERLAFEVTKLVHGQEEADKAMASAKSVFGGGADGDMPTTELPPLDIDTSEVTSETGADVTEETPAVTEETTAVVE